MEWRSIIETDGLYEVSSCGQVRRKGNPPLKLISNHDGYSVVSIYVGGRYVQRRVHRLVAQAFIGDVPFEGAEVAHKDGTRSHNAVDNLRWDTRAGNQKDRLAHGTHSRGARSYCAKFSDSDVVNIRAALATGAATRRQLADQYNVSYETIRAMHMCETYQDAR